MLRRWTLDAKYERQLVTAADGGTIGLDYFRGVQTTASLPAGAPVLLVLHGVTGARRVSSQGAASMFTGYCYGGQNVVGLTLDPECSHCCPRPVVIQVSSKVCCVCHRHGMHVVQLTAA